LAVAPEKPCCHRPATLKSICRPQSAPLSHNTVALPIPYHHPFAPLLTPPNPLWTVKGCYNAAIVRCFTPGILFTFCSSQRCRILKLRLLVWTLRPAFRFAVTAGPASARLESSRACIQHRGTYPVLLAWTGKITERANTSLPAKSEPELRPKYGFVVALQQKRFSCAFFARTKNVTLLPPVIDFPAYLMGSSNVVPINVSRSADATCSIVCKSRC
jgi:hypothetical protein